MVRANGHAASSLAAAADVHAVAVRRTRVAARLLLADPARLSPVNPINWVIVVGWLTYVVIYGIRRSRGATDMDAYLRASRSLPWWAVGLSVMATQFSAVTMIGTTGQGATDGMRFIQFYFGLPVAMVILGVTLVPFLHGVGRLYRVRVPRAPVRREDALADGVSVPDLARHVVRHDRRRAGRGVLGHLRMADQLVASR